MGRRVIPLVFIVIILLSGCNNLDLSAQLEESIRKSQGITGDVLFSPNPDQVYTSSTTVSLTTDTADVDQIRYTAVSDASDPGSDYSSWAVYDEESGIVLSDQDVTTTIYAIALKSDMMPSNRVSGWYKITGTCAAPVISPAVSTPAASHSVTLSTSTPGATIKYTLDGTTPGGDNGETYDAGVTIAFNSTLKAMVFKADWASSAVTEEDYTIAWSRTHGDGASDENVVSGVVAFDGKYFISSSTSGSAANSHLTGLNSDGTLAWSVEYAQPLASVGKNITLSVDASGNPDGGVVTCGRRTTSYTELFKINADGSIGWHNRLNIEGIGGSSNYPSYEAIKSLSDGRYIASGSKFSDGGPTQSPMVSLISNSGTVNNSFLVGLIADASEGILVTPGLDVVKSGETDTGFVICGYLDTETGSGEDFSFIAFADLNNAEASRRTWKVSTPVHEDFVYLYSVCAASDGTFVVAGTGNGVIPMNPEYNTVVFKIDPAMEPANARIWEKSFGFTSGNEAFFEVIETPDGDFIAVGEAEDQVTGSSGKDGWIVKFDGAGNYIWQKAYGGLSWDTLRSITPAGDGGYIVTGMTESLGIDRDSWTMKIDSEGNPELSDTTKNIYLGVSTFGNVVNPNVDFEVTYYTISDSSLGIEYTQMTSTSSPSGWTITDTQYE